MTSRQQDQYPKVPVPGPYEDTGDQAVVPDLDEVQQQPLSTDPVPVRQAEPVGVWQLPCRYGDSVKANVSDGTGNNMPEVIPADRRRSRLLIWCTGQPLVVAFSKQDALSGRGVTLAAAAWPPLELRYAGAVFLVSGTGGQVSVANWVSEQYAD